MRALALSAAILALGCHAAPGAVGNAVLMSAVAGVASANRVAGGCYSVCQQGESCNEKTGLCEALPCRGRCRADETCEEGFFGVKCLPGPALSVSTSSAAPAKSSEPEKPPVPDAAKP